MKLSDLDSYAEGKILAGCIDLTGYVVTIILKDTMLFLLQCTKLLQKLWKLWP